MPLEIEAKMQVEDHDALRARLRASGARHVGDLLETDTFFDTPDHALRSADRGLRLRCVRDAARGTVAFVVTFKGPAGVSQLKTREELEFNISDGDAGRQVFERLGFRPGITFEKRRQSWVVEDCHVELDELPHLGTFVEIEGPSEQMILRVRERLALQSWPMIKKSYVAMFADLIDRAQVSGPKFTFDSVKRVSPPRCRPEGSFD